MSVTKWEEGDLRLITTLMSPEYVIAAAKQFGEGDPVRGATAAYQEVRTLVREYIRFIRFRDGLSGQDLQLALVLRALGWIPRNYQHVLPVEETEWNQTAQVFWPTGADMPGFVTIDVGDASQQDVNLLVIQSTSKMLREHPSLNKAFLQGRTYQRQSPEVMIHVDIRGEIRSLVMDASDKDRRWIERRLRRGMRALLKAEKDPLVRKLSSGMLRSWAEAGFITSPAGAMISLVGDQGVPQGIAPLVPANGIPLTVTVGKVENGKVILGLNGDHRVFNGSQMGQMYQYLKSAVSGRTNESNSDWRV